MNCPLCDQHTMVCPCVRVVPTKVDHRPEDTGHESKKDVRKNISSGEDAFWESVASHPGFMMQLDNL